MNKRSYLDSLVLLFFVVVLLSACSNQETQRITEQKKEKEYSLQEALENANRITNRNEEELINNYIERRKWPTSTLVNGARLWEYKKGEGKRIDYNDQVDYLFRIEAISGDLIASGKETLIIGNSELPTGLNEALLSLCKGSKAKLILPSHLGYGLTGDGDKIPKMAILVYDIEILNKK